jgi:hypothetical protein
VIVSVATLLSIGLGLGLSAACGFRVFVPLLVVNLAARAGWIQLSGELAWMGENGALWTFGIATVLEIGAYYLPWLDNFLDAVATPAAVVAGAVVTASVVTDVDPALKWVLAVIAGGGVAGMVQSATVGGRIVSSLTTAGLGNPVLATLELLGSLGLSVVAVLAPLLALVFVIVLLLVIWGVRRRRRAQAEL